jgi:hypothetical protein
MTIMSNCVGLPRVFGLALAAMAIWNCGGDQACGAAPRAIPRPGIGNEIEGGILDYRATRAKEPAKTGRFRIKGSAIFEVGRLRRPAEQEKRIGDYLQQSDKPDQLVFLDNAPLQGRAHVVYNREKKFWSGHLDDENGKRWRFEIRKSED